MIDQMLDELFEVLFLGPDGPLLDARMALKPDASAATHFIAAPRPRLTRADMERLDQEGLMAELARILDDLPVGRRDEVLGRISRIAEALATEGQNGGDSEPPSLIYALH